jgi:hypothetical protein
MGQAMKQRCSLFCKVGEVTLSIPSAEENVMPGVGWGSFGTHGSPANRFKAISNLRMERPMMRMFHRWTLSQGVGWLFVEGQEHNSVGRAAFERLDAFGAFGASAPDVDQLTQWLDEPLTVRGFTEPLRYPWTPGKVRELASALHAVAALPPQYDARLLRDWLATLSGIEMLDASWVVRYVMEPNTIAVIDPYLLRNGRAIGLFPLHLTIQHDYLLLEELALEFCNQLGVQPQEWHCSVLDDAVWEIAELDERVEALRAARGDSPAIRQERTSKRAFRTRDSGRARGLDRTAPQL